MGAKFLCCLPLRLGVLLVSIVQFILNSLVAAIMWYSLWYVHEKSHEDLSTRTKIWTILYGVIYSVGGIMALFGFIGTLLKKFSFVSGFASTLWYLFFVEFIWSIIALVFWFLEPKDRLLRSCLNGAKDDQKTIDACHSIFDPEHINSAGVIAGVIAVFVIPLLLQLYGCYLVGAYAKKLQKKDMDRNMILTTSGGFKYTAAGTDDDSRPLTQHDGLYPYKDTNHSYGNNGGHHA
ncbi:hypothetical protein PC9H_007723 [Pleurotus ostreatus]|uniref:Uncharacterized protein n=1 Tax=Pleurotus ostreatus TaxID=5322 RepID=A0A8H6ZU04_PLEOS|nr:uncharacterized protein PC9H_007723 [Pleurotus ostreatus]KAF7428499.1 hypothetical protein PC9H_007723 [Pleurotus ostreatus]KAJ8696650.1 hypothetical protein PTI98_006501 [Pleurotus ostreatus]